MLIETYMGGIALEEDFHNGVNVIFKKGVGDKMVTLVIECDGGKKLIPEFEIEISELILVSEIMSK